jgi:hypothetical protein
VHIIYIAILKIKGKDKKLWYRMEEVRCPEGEGRS